MEADPELPKAQVKRIVKAKLGELLGGSEDAKRQVALNADALLAFREAARVFICYITSAANDICREAKRSTVSAEDVLEGLQDLDFGEFISPLKESLKAFQQESKEKNKKKAEQLKKRKERLSMSPGQDGAKGACNEAVEPEAKKLCLAGPGGQPGSEGAANLGEAESPKDGSNEQLAAISEEDDVDGVDDDDAAAADAAVNETEPKSGEADGPPRGLNSMDPQPPPQPAADCLGEDCW